MFAEETMLKAKINYFINKSESDTITNEDLIIIGANLIYAEFKSISKEDTLPPLIDKFKKMYPNDKGLKIICYLLGSIMMVPFCEGNEEISKEHNIDIPNLEECMRKMSDFMHSMVDVEFSGKYLEKFYFHKSFCNENLANFLKLMITLDDSDFRNLKVTLDTIQ